MQRYFVVELDIVKCTPGWQSCPDENDTWRFCTYLLHGITITLRWRHNAHDDVSNHRCLYCLLNRLFRHRSKKSSKLRVTGLCEGSSPVTSQFPAQRASNAENAFIWWRHRLCFTCSSSVNRCTYSNPHHGSILIITNNRCAWTIW